MKKSLFLASILTFLLISCTKEKEEGGVLIRVQNETIHRADDVSVFSFSRADQADITKNYGSVNAGTTSGYQRHDQVFNSPFYTLKLQGLGDFEVTGTCGVGLTNLADGKYAMVIKSDSYNNVYINFVKE